tara:strand:- start:2570 stop:3160 length:591 start_codon:yes stop_codon:yes gene_type:complete
MQNVFIDRDGVILKNIFYDDTGEFEGPRCSKDIEFKSYSIEALKILQKFSNIFLISNQPNASKEKTKIKYIYETNLKFEKILRQNNIFFESFNYSYHHPKGKNFIEELNCNECFGYKVYCHCRKPSNFFLKKILNSGKYQNKYNWFIGDRETDIECGLSIKASTILISNKKNNKTKARYIVKNLYDSLNLIIKNIL